jgi:hypothetical protein
VTLHKITVYFETDDPEDVDNLMRVIERAICPHPAASDHRCPHRWMTISSELDEDDAAEVEALLNE